MPPGKRLLFIGISGREYPHTRVRCYSFAEILSKRFGVETEVLSFKEDLATGRTERDMYENLRDRDKLLLTMKALGRLWNRRNTVLYVQKAHFHSAAPFLLHRLRGMPYIFDYDDYDIPLSNFFSRGRYNRLFFGSHKYDEITYRMARRALCCIASSHFLVDFLKAHNPKVHLVETGVNTDLFHPPDDQSLQDRFRYFWNGIIWGEPIWKNVEFVLKAFRRVHEKHPEPELLFAVGGLLLDRFKEFVRKEYGDLPVRILDWVPPSAMPDILRSVRVGLLPLVQKEEWFQAKSPTKLYEYMASGLAVVASPTGEANYIIRDGEDGIFADGLEGFTAAMMRLYEEPALCETMSRSASERARSRYSLDVLGEKLYSAIGGFLRPE